MQTEYKNVTALAEASVYFDGKCISHTILLEDGSKKSMGVILPASLAFSTGAPEQMDIIKGSCRVKLDGSDNWSSYSTGDTFHIAGSSRFQIETTEPLHYVCHYG